MATNTTTRVEPSEEQPYVAMEEGRSPGDIDQVMARCCDFGFGCAVLTDACIRGDIRPLIAPPECPNYRDYSPGRVLCCLFVIAVGLVVGALALQFFSE